MTREELYQKTRREVRLAMEKIANKMEASGSDKIDSIQTKVQIKLTPSVEKISLDFELSDAQEMENAEKKAATCGRSENEEGPVAL